MDAVEDAASAARAVAEEFVNAFNCRDIERNRNVFNFPSVLLVPGRVVTWDRPADFTISWDTLAEIQDWHHSVLDSVEVVQAGVDKVHLLVTFSRFNSHGEKYATTDGFWAVTRVDGHWGIQCRSIFAA